MKTIEEIKRDVISQIRDYSTFKQHVKLKSRLESFALMLFMVSIGLLLFNTVSTIGAMFEYSIPMEYFFDVFFSSEGEDIVFYMLTMFSFFMLLPAMIAWILQRARRESSYKKLYEHFQLNSIILSERLVRLTKLHLASFVDESDTILIQQIKDSDEFTQNKKLNKYLKPNYIVNNLPVISKLLTKTFHTKSKIKKIYIANQKDVVECSDGCYRLYLFDTKEHAIHLEKTNGAFSKLKENW